MNGGRADDDNMNIGSYNVQLDLTELLHDMLAMVGKHREKTILEVLLLKLSGHQVELSKVLAGAFPGLEKEMLTFYEKRAEAIRQSLRLGKLISFRSSKWIEEECARRAWEETRAMMKEVSALKSEGLMGIVDDHREVLRRLCRAMVDLVTAENPQVNLDWDALRRFLEGQRP
jgi:hypothetical protein